MFDPANFPDTTDARNFGGSIRWSSGRGHEYWRGGQEARSVHIKQVVGESEVVERTKELIKAEDSNGGMKAFIEARAGKDKEVKVAKDTYSILLALFDSDPKLTLIKLVGYDASPAKIYEPVVLEEPEGVQDEEGSEVSAFSSDAKQVDAASTATEPSLFGDEPVGVAPGPTAGDFFNTLASDNDTLPMRPRAALPATPLPLPLPTKSFRMHPKKEDSTSSLFTRTLITSKFDTAVEACIQARRWADALLLAQGEGVWAAEMPKEERCEAARVCFTAGKKLDRLVAIWDEEAKEEEGQNGSYGVRAWAVQSLIEKAVAFSSAVGFLDPNFQSNNGKIYVLAPLYNLFLEYPQIFPAQGMVSDAVRYFERVLAGYGDVQWLKGTFEKKTQVNPAQARDFTPKFLRAGRERCWK
ncbi:hypothetical protein RSOLAG22IIIB_07522 [Rhizoctonia solani]|uniref:Uncharacterized protein n=1 Tax=Rhizoctonia solani TaxID=456999 RepID=A0A0K6FNJ5_9AGAM|nr:hypothetical protein RSOLAG22IIIB_07522 [Rhizoctonia solani]